MCSTYANITDLVIFRHIETVNEDLVMCMVQSLVRFIREAQSLRYC